MEILQPWFASCLLLGDILIKLKSTLEKVEHFSDFWEKKDVI